MIFITLGSQKFQFNRVLKKIDELVREKIITEEIFAQIGYSDYKPQHYAYKEFLDRDEFRNWMHKSDVVITHGGTGAIIGAVKAGKKVLAAPRLEEYGEHVDNHQVQIINEFEKMNLIYGLYDFEELRHIEQICNQLSSPMYKSNTSRIVDAIGEFLVG